MRRGENETANPERTTVGGRAQPGRGSERGDIHEQEWGEVAEEVREAAEGTADDERDA